MDSQKGQKSGWDATFLEQFHHVTEDSHDMLAWMPFWDGAETQDALVSH
jgi:hypothetical protein